MNNRSKGKRGDTIQISNQTKEVAMKTALRPISSFLFVLLITTLTYGQAAEKTLVKSFAVMPQQTVSVNIAAPIEVKNWDNTLLRVQITITLPNGNEALLKSLVSAGRYNVVAKEADGSLILTSPGLEREALIGNKAIEEVISIVIFAPREATVKLIHNTALSSSL